MRGAVFIGQDGCEHQEFMQHIQIIHGTGLDSGTVAIQIGTCTISFDSTAALIAALVQRESPIAVIGN